MNTNEQLSRDVVSLRCKDYMVNAIKNPKNVLNSFYDKMHLINVIGCEPFGYKQ